MDTLSYKTQFAKPGQIDQAWVLVDAENQVLGRVASLIAKLIRGKHKASYSPNANCGDKVVVINAEKVILTGKKMTDKQLIRYTGYPGGQRMQTPQELLNKFPERLLEIAIKGMVPKNRNGRKAMGNLFIYAGTKHPHEAQNPKAYTI